MAPQFRIWFAWASGGFIMPAIALATQNVAVVSVITQVLFVVLGISSQRGEDDLRQAVFVGPERRPTALVVVRPAIPSRARWNKRTGFGRPRTRARCARRLLPCRATHAFAVFSAQYGHRIVAAAFEYARVSVSLSWQAAADNLTALVQAPATAAAKPSASPGRLD
ncbi:hypothetical protein J7F01_15200 [Streptomyces sp. ISL-22]|uniref:hypothetical protein n=1 Tax=unclassified Streptomyces TaxID=2593676 RepID=UPI001BE588D0|nr:MULTISPECIES: hypothetical protein [unclassified Streptomyces]MBT2423789.1 hypothetical protein [Streptomyces sp. ISL-24]MBT2433509.1 hypothetical protein [Streptomyces sp. ISL-22]